MVKNIYIFAGDCATNFLIKQYCRQNKEYLAENNLYHIDVQDFWGTVKYSDWVDFYHDNVLRGRQYFQKNFSDEFSFDNFFTQLKEYIENNGKENIIIVMANEFYSALLPRLNLICKLFPESAVHCEILTVNFFRQVSAYYNLFFFMTSKKSFYRSLSERYVNLTSVIPQLMQEISNKKENILKAEQMIKTFHNEVECFTYWLNKFNLQNKWKFPVQATLAPQVLAFLTAIKEYYFSEKPFDFTNEWDFLYAYSSKALYSYCSEAIKKDFYERFPDAGLQGNDEYEEIDCSQASLRISLEDALFLAEKISPAGRKELIKDVNRDDIDYMPVTSKTAYLALMYAEGHVTAEEIQTFLKPKCGRVTLPVAACNKEPILTVYTTSYNNKEYLQKCIESVLEQKTQYPFIHLIADDNSTDGSQELILEYAKKYPHIQVILRKENSVHTNYHAIFNNISTKYAAVCDCDDYYTDPYKIEKQIQFLEANPGYGLSFHSTYVYDQGKEVMKSIYPESLQHTDKTTFYISSFIQNNLMQSSSVLFRWKLRNGVQHNMPLFCTPFDWTLVLIHSYLCKINFIKDIMSFYRRHSGAGYFDTEVDVDRFIVNNSYRELLFCKCLDLYTEKKYHMLFLKKAFTILLYFYDPKKYEKINIKRYQIIKKRVEQIFSDYIMLYNGCKKLNENLETQKNNT